MTTTLKRSAKIPINHNNTPTKIGAILMNNE